MFKIEFKEIRDKQDINIGTEVVFSGAIKYGLPPDKIRELQTAMNKIEQLAKTDIIALNIQSLEFWDSLGVNTVLGPVVRKINRELSSRGKQPVSLVGNRKSDNYLAAKDKFPEVGTNSLPWYSAMPDLIVELDKG